MLDAIEPAPVACLSPHDLARLGLAGGEIIRVATQVGNGLVSTVFDEIRAAEQYLKDLQASR